MNSRLYTHTHSTLQKHPARNRWVPHSNTAFETACAFWQLLLPEYEYIDEWIAYVSDNYGKSISKGIKTNTDTWMQFYDFAKGDWGEGFSKYDVGGAWPVLIDSFVLHTRHAAE
jgi:Cullin binding